jgi:hypothetical protein
MDSSLPKIAAKQHSPLQIKVWSSLDGAEINSFKQDQTPNTKRFISEVQGDLWGDRFATETLGYKPILHPDSKSIRQGFDAIYFDPTEQEYVVAEFKGQTSHESTIQAQPSWVVDTCHKICKAQPPYQNVSEYERQMAQDLLTHYQQGHVLRYEVIRTGVDSASNRFYSQLEKQTRLELDRNSPSNLDQAIALILKERGHTQADGTVSFQGNDYDIQSKGQLLSIYRSGSPPKLSFQKEGDQVLVNQLEHKDIAKFLEAQHRLSLPLAFSQDPQHHKFPELER